MVELIKAFKKNEGIGTKATPVGFVSPDYTVSRRVTLDWERIAANRCVGLLPGSPESNDYKVLRTSIARRMQANGWRTLMITSLQPGEGKTVTAINLAAMFAKEFHRTVLLVDADLAGQPIQRYLGFESDRGLVDYILGDCRVDEMIVWPQVEKFTVVSGGRTVQETTELLSSPRMQALVDELKNRYADRTIFFDVPCIRGSADAMAFSAVVDAILIVVQAGKTPLPDLRSATAQLPEEKIVGFVMNRL